MTKHNANQILEKAKAKAFKDAHAQGLEEPCAFMRGFLKGLERKVIAVQNRGY
jgi:hypothetical protein